MPLYLKKSHHSRGFDVFGYKDQDCRYPKAHWQWHDENTPDDETYEVEMHSNEKKKNVWRTIWMEDK